MLKTTPTRCCVSYRVFPRDDDDIEALLRRMNAFVLQHTHTHIWQRECFTLRIAESSALLPHLNGSVEFGDCVEDEWFVVCVLKMLTTEFMGVCIEVMDDDGQLLLIETANVLPDWLHPDNDKHRVFLYHNALHIIPHTHTPHTHIDALRIVRDEDIPTRASEAIQHALQIRLNAVPTIEQSTHYTRCLLSTQAAALLHKKPSLIAAAVEAFYHRDPVACQYAAAMRILKPTCNTITWSRVRFTRCLFAQLCGQKTEGVPKAFAEWPVFAEDSDEDIACQRGIRVMCGLEMIIRSAMNNAAHNDDNKHTYSSAHDILSVLESVSADTQEISIATHESFQALGADDSNEWMSLSPDDVDTLTKAYNPSNLGHTIASKLDTFMTTSSGIDGVDIDDDNSEDDENDDTDVAECALNFDVFMSALRGDNLDELKDEKEMRAHMRELDSELQQCQRVQHIDNDDECSDVGSTVNMNLVCNMLKAYAAEGGSAGPASSMMHSLGVRLPDDDGHNAD